MDVQRKTGDMIVRHRLRPEVAVVHRPQDMEGAKDRDPPHSLAHIVVNFIRVSVDIRLELVLAVESRDIYAVTVHIRIRRMPARPPQSPLYMEVEDRAS